MTRITQLIVCAVLGLASAAGAQGIPKGSRDQMARDRQANAQNPEEFEHMGEDGNPYPVELPPGFKVLQPMAAQPKKLMDPELKQEVYYVPLVLDYVRWGLLPNRSAKPIVTVPSGSLVEQDVVSHEGLLEDQGRDPVKFFGGYGIPATEVLDDAKAVAASDIPHNFYHDGPHVISPPVGVAGAEPGDVLKIDVLRLEPRVPYGVNSIRHGLGSLPQSFPKTASTEPGADAARNELFHNVSFVIPIHQAGGQWYAAMPNGSGQNSEVPVRPFLGVMGVALDTSRLPSSVPPGQYGGNLDLHNLTVGSTLYLPVLVPGAQFYVSDSHFAQGNGEVSLTAIEGSLRATLRLTVLKKEDAALPMPTPLQMPFAETPDYWIPIGIASEMDDAMVDCIQQGVTFLTTKLGYKSDNALSQLSIGTDFNISEVVDQTMEVHGLIRKADFHWGKAAVKEIP